MSTTRRVYPVFWREIQACFLHTTSIQQRCILYHTLENAVNSAYQPFRACEFSLTPTRQTPTGGVSTGRTVPPENV